MSDPTRKTQLGWSSDHPPWAAEPGAGATTPLPPQIAPEQATHVQLPVFPDAGYHAQHPTIYAPPPTARGSNHYDQPLIPEYPPTPRRYYVMPVLPPPPTDHLARYKVRRAVAGGTESRRSAYPYLFGALVASVGLSWLVWYLTQASG